MKHRFTVSLLIIAMMLLTLTGFAIGKDVNLTIGIVSFNDAAKEWLENELIPNFESEHPNIKVEIMWLDWGRINEQLLSAFAAGVGPDLFQHGISSSVAAYAANGRAMKLNDLVENWEQWDDYFDSGKLSVTFEDDIFGLPQLIDCRPFFYRKDFFREVGLDPDKPPTTWEELRDYAIKLTKYEGDQMVRAGFLIHTTDFPAFQEGWYPFMLQNGVGILTPDMKKSGFDSPEAIEAAQFFHDLLYKHEVDILGGLPTGIADVHPLVVGTAAMAFGTSAVIRDMERYNPELLDELAIAPPLGRVQQATMSGGTALMIHSQTKHPEEAWLFMKYMNSPENVLTYVQLLGSLPALKSLQNDPYFAEDPLRRASMETVPYAYAWPASRHHNDYRLMIVSATEEFMQNIKTPEAALKDLAREMNRILSR